MVGLVLSQGSAPGIQSPESTVLPLKRDSGILAGALHIRQDSQRRRCRDLSGSRSVAIRCSLEGEERSATTYEKDEWQAPRETNGCQNCGKPEGTLPGFYGYGVDCRCIACSQHQKVHDGEQPPRLYEKGEWRGNTRVKEGCATCGKPEGAEGECFNYGDDRRCDLCYNYERQREGKKRSKWLYMNDTWRGDEKMKNGC